MQSQQSCISELEKEKSEALKVDIPLLYNKGLFDSFENKGELFDLIYLLVMNT